MTRWGDQRSVIFAGSAATGPISPIIVVDNYDAPCERTLRMLRDWKLRFNW